MENPETTSPQSYQAGFVAVMGRPNVGKSTLINALLGQKIAAVSPRPQTTRRRQLGILTRQNAQVIFVDTPGIHRPKHKLGEWMVEEAKATLEDADLILFVVDANQDPTEEDHILAGMLADLKQPAPILLILNKIDQISEEQLSARRLAYLSLLPDAQQQAGRVEVQPVSAARGDHQLDLLAQIIARMPQGEPFYPEGQITDLYEREIAADLIREAALIHLRDEVPHGINVRIDEFTERNEHGAYIAATIFVEREGHKAIVIGQGGGMLKKIGTTARQEIEAMSERKVFLELRVKVRKNWRDNEQALKWFGYKFEKK
jgi:GTP-binding protein Era